LKDRTVPCHSMAIGEQLKPVRAILGRHVWTLAIPLRDRPQPPPRRRPRQPHRATNSILICVCLEDGIVLLKTTHILETSKVTIYGFVSGRAMHGRSARTTPTKCPDRGRRSRLESKTRVWSGDRRLKGGVVVGTVPDYCTGQSIASGSTR
jgi:hypothetical protein